jgi:hypothetical protein
MPIIKQSTSASRMTVQYNSLNYFVLFVDKLFIRQLAINNPPRMPWFPYRSAYRYTQVPQSPVSSHREVKLWIGTSLRSRVCEPIKLPSMALDSGIHAGMTVLFDSIWLMTAGIIYCELPNSIFKFLIFEFGELSHNKR